MAALPPSSSQPVKNSKPTSFDPAAQGSETKAGADEVTEFLQMVYAKFPKELASDFNLLTKAIEKNESTEVQAVINRIYQAAQPLLMAEASSGRQIVSADAQTKTASQSQRAIDRDIIINFEYEANSIGRSVNDKYEAAILAKLKVTKAEHDKMYNKFIDKGADLDALKKEVDSHKRAEDRNVYEYMQKYFTAKTTNISSLDSEAKMITDLYKAEFCKLVDKNNIPQQDCISFCIGGYGVSSQTWPKPLLDARKQQQSVLNVVLDPQIGVNHLKASALTSSLQELRKNDSDSAYAKIVEGIKLNKYECLFPFEYYENRPYAPYSPWSKEDVEKFKKDWFDFLDISLSKGKTIFLGYHLDGLPSGFFIEAYEALKKKYSQNIFLLIGHGNYSAIPNGPINADQASKARMRDKSVQDLFHFFPREDGGLSNEEITLANLRKWAQENTKTVN